MLGLFIFFVGVREFIESISVQVCDDVFLALWFEMLTISSVCVQAFTVAEQVVYRGAYYEECEQLRNKRPT